MDEWWAVAVLESEEPLILQAKSRIHAEIKAANRLKVAVDHCCAIKAIRAYGAPPMFGYRCEVEIRVIDRDLAGLVEAGRNINEDWLMLVGEYVFILCPENKYEDSQRQKPAR